MTEQADQEEFALFSRKEGKVPIIEKSK